MEMLTTIIVAIIGSGVINTALNHFLLMKEKAKDEEDGAKEAARLMMKDRLRFLCIHYIHQEWIYEDELEDLIAMHNCYHDNLKGNGYLDDLMRRVKNLEIRGIGVK